MSRRTNCFGKGLIISVALGLCTLGCNQDSNAPAEGNQQAGAEEGASPMDNEHGHVHDAEAERIAATLAKLPADDRATAERQRICPVSQEPLGSMGVPPKMAVDGRDVFICCAGCADALQADPEEYLANLPEQEAGD